MKLKTMSNIEKIRQKIERRKKSLRAGICNDEAFTRKQKEEMLVASGELTRLSRFLDSLPGEKPSEDLKEEVKRYYSDNFTYISSDQPTLSILTNVAHYFAEWQKEQMMKEAVEGFIFQSEDYYPKELVAQYNGELKHGDKVKIIIVKED